MPSCQLLKKFQSTLPVRGATVGVPSSDTGTVFQSTLPVRGATGRRRSGRAEIVISIHAPREGSDPLYEPEPMEVILEFQSTLPVRGATGTQPPLEVLAVRFQSTLPVRGATWRAIGKALDKAISIHAPREGSDAGPIGWSVGHHYFNPRSP